MPDFIFDLPLYVTSLLIVTVFCAFSLLGLEVVRRVVLPRLRVTGDDSEFIGAMVQAIMVFYGLAVALIAFSVWETHSQVADNVSLEASRVAEAYRDVSSYPEPLRTELREELHSYLGNVINEEWPALRKGEHPAGGVKWMDRFQESMNRFEPATEREKILHAEALHAFNALIEARRLRLDALLTELSVALWIVVGAGGLISLSATFFFKVADVRLHRIQVLLLAIFIGMVISLILAFERPFRGDLGVDPGPYELIREQLMEG